MEDGGDVSPPAHHVPMTPAQPPGLNLLLKGSAILSPNQSSQNFGNAQALNKNLFEDVKVRVKVPLANLQEGYQQNSLYRNSSHHRGHYSSLNSLS